MRDLSSADATLADTSESQGLPGFITPSSSSSRTIPTSTSSIQLHRSKSVNDLTLRRSTSSLKSRIAPNCHSPCMNSLRGPSIDGVPPEGHVGGVHDEACFVDPPFPSPMPSRLVRLSSCAGFDENSRQWEENTFRCFRRSMAFVSAGQTCSDLRLKMRRKEIKIDFMTELPIELALYIFLKMGDDRRSLVRCRLVSKKWRVLAEDPVVWREMFLNQRSWGVKRMFKTPSQHPKSNQLSFWHSPTPLQPCPLVRSKMDGISEMEEELQDQAVPAQTFGQQWSSDDVLFSPVPPLSRQSTMQSYQANGSGNVRIARRLSQLLGEVALPLMDSDLTLISHDNDPLDEILTVHQESSTADKSQVDSSLQPYGVFSSSNLNSTTSPPHARHDSRYISTSASHMQKESESDTALDWFQMYRDRSVIATRWKEGKQISKSLKGHQDSIYCLQLIKDRIYTGSRDRTVKVWDATSGACIKTLHGHEGSVLCLRCDDTIMLTGSSDCKVIVWDMLTHSIRQELIGHRSGVLDLAFNSNWIVSCSKDTTIKVWCRNTGKLAGTICGHSGPVNALQLANNGTLLSASGDSTMKLWEVGSRNLLRTFDGHLRGLACIKLIESLGLVISGSNDETIKVWDVNTGQCLKTLMGHEGLVRTLDVDVAERRLVSGSYDKTIKVWDFETGEMKLDFRKGQRSLVFDLKIDFGRIVSVGHDPNMMILNFAHGIDCENFCSVSV